jgi:hypothetical protein
MISISLSCSKSAASVRSTTGREPSLLIVSVDGYMYGLDPLTGAQLWFNPMEGFGTGVTSLVSANGTGSSAIIAAAAQIAANQSHNRSAHSPGPP